MSDNPFDGETEAVIEVKYEDLVGDDKKYKTQEDVAKAIVEKDRFIERLKAEKAEVLEALTKKANEEEFLAKLEKVTSTRSPEPQDPPVDKGSPAVTAVTPEDIEALLDKRETDRKRKANLAAVTAKLDELYGDNYKARVQSQAKELGVGTQFLTDLASDNPTAFFRLMGTESKREDTFSPPPRSAVNLEAPTRSGAKDYGHFQRLRQEKGEGWYFSPSTQQEIWKAAKEAEKRGERFLPE